MSYHLEYFNIRQFFEQIEIKSGLEIFWKKSKHTNQFFSTSSNLWFEKNVKTETIKEKVKYFLKFYNNFIFIYKKNQNM